MAWFQWFRRRPSADESQPAQPNPRNRAFFAERRRYLSETAYMLPKDLQEINRLDFQHYLLRYVLHGSYAAPIRHPLSILDVGTGTGRWAIEMAQQFPRARVVGLDLEPNPQREAATPPNYAFVQGNLFDGLPYQNGEFDFVHQRFFVAAMRANQWQPSVNELARVTNRGGWVELIEGAYVRGGGAHLAQIRAWSDVASQYLGIDFSMITHIGDFLRQAGLKHVTQRELVIPLGSRFGRLGNMMEINFFNGLDAIKPMMMRIGVASEADYQREYAGLKQEVSNGLCEFPYYAAFGQK